MADEFAAGKSSLLYELETDDGEVLPLRVRRARRRPAPETGSPSRAGPGAARSRSTSIRPAPRAPLGRDGPELLDDRRQARPRHAPEFHERLVVHRDDRHEHPEPLLRDGLERRAATTPRRRTASSSMTGDVVLVTATVAKPTTCDTGDDPDAGERAGAGRRLQPRELQLPRLGLPVDRRLRLERPRLRRRRRLVDQRRADGVVGPPRRGPRARPQLRRPARALVRLRGRSRSRPRAARAANTATASTRWATRAPGHFNAQFKDTFGWLPGGHGRKCTAGGTATYTLGALEAPGQSTYAVKIPTTGTSPARTYWVEWRSRTGFDAGEPATIVNGGLIRHRAERRRRSRPPRHDARDVDVRRRPARRRLVVQRSRADPHDHGALEDRVVPHGPGRLRRAAARVGLPHARALPGLRHAQRERDLRRAGALRGPDALVGRHGAGAACPRRRSRSPATSRSRHPTAAGSVRLVPGGRRRRARRP